MIPALPSNAILRVLDPGIGLSLQDRGRPGWRRFGVPPSGWMDPHAALAAHRLIETDPSAPLLELLLHGSRLEMLEPAWIALTGAEVKSSIPTWRAYHAAAGEVIHLQACPSGVWSYLAIEGGLEAPRFLGSASYYARGQIGLQLVGGSILARVNRPRFQLPPGIAGRLAARSDRWDLSAPATIPVWPGPQWDEFSPEARATFLEAEWKVSPQSDRSGFRLSGPALEVAARNRPSEPVRLGSIQVPGGGEPIVTMNDGPTVGGYAKIALVDGPDHLARVAQTRPGQTLRFQMIPS